MSLNKATLAVQIYQILRSDILCQNIRSGEKLTLQMLKDRFEVSSTPIREALTRLAEEGLVHYYSNIGVKVISLDENDLTELYQFMGDLDSLSIRYAFDSPNRDALIRELTELLEKTTMLESLESLTPEQTREWITCSDRFHLIFYDYCNNSRLKAAASKLRSQLTIFSNIYETQPEVQRQITSKHKEIFEACVQGDFTLASIRMKEHLNESLTHALRCL